MTTITASNPSALKMPFSSAMINGSPVVPMRVVRPMVIRPSWAGRSCEARKTRRVATSNRRANPSFFISPPDAGQLDLLLNPGIPQDRITAQAWSEEVDLQLGGAARAKVLVIFADIRFTRGKRRHNFSQVHAAM